MLVQSLTDPPFVHALLHRAYRQPFAALADEDRRRADWSTSRTSGEPLLGVVPVASWAGWRPSLARRGLRGARPR